MTNVPWNYEGARSLYEFCWGGESALPPLSQRLWASFLFISEVRFSLRNDLEGNISGENREYNFIPETFGKGAIIEEAV